jgi:hypothetical protein
MKVSVRATESGIGASALLARLRGHAPAVAEEPRRASLLLDVDSGELRQRVAGGDRLTRGSTVTIGFSAARAERLVDRRKRDLQGQGELTYRIAYAVSFDGGASFAREKRLTSRRTDEGAVVFEAAQEIPAEAASMLLYAHVQAVLAGEREIVLADVYDNPGGAFTNYAFELV